VFCHSDSASETLGASSLLILNTGRLHIFSCSDFSGYNEKKTCWELLLSKFLIEIDPMPALLCLLLTVAFGNRGDRISQKFVAF
jgi:hypothetical protein